MIYYTLQIHFQHGASIVVEERKDLSAPENTDEKLWRTNIREKIYTTGIEIRHKGNGSFEFVSPFKIHNVFLLRQDAKFGV